MSSADVVINDDLRDSEVDYPRLAAEGFAFLRVVCADEVRAARLSERGDRTVVADSDATWGYDRIEPRWSLDTTTLVHQEQLGLVHESAGVTREKIFR